jgi:glycerol-3-phosphate dehydrogenase
MLSTGELTEGYPAIATAWRFTQERAIKNLPLLEALHAVVWQGADVATTLSELRLTT